MGRIGGGVVGRLRRWAGALKAEAVALWLAGRDPRTPWYAKAVIVAVAAYALSPIDLVPDFIPVLGYVDDLIIVPAGIALAVSLVPVAVMADCRQRAAARLAGGRERLAAGALLVVCVWVVAAALLGWLVWRVAT